MPVFVGASREDLERVLTPSITNYTRLVTETLAPAIERSPDGPEKTRLLGIVSNMKATTFARMNEGMALFDRPERCVARLRGLRNRLGFGRLIAWFNFGGMIPHHRVTRSTEVFSSEVMPFFSENEEDAEALSA